MKKILAAAIILASLKAGAQCKTETKFEMMNCGDSRVSFIKKCAPQTQPDVIFIHVHENEKTAVQAADSMLAKYCRSCFVTWKGKDDRYFNFKLGSLSYKFDPNRIYTTKGREATLKANGDFSQEAFDKVSQLAKLFTDQYLDNYKLVVALHNNTDSGGLSILSFRKGGDYANDAAKVYVNKRKDADDFFLTTSPRIYQYLKKKGFNILLQDNSKVTDDGSLSVYAAQKNIAYLNIEAQHGHLQQQLTMLDAVQQMIKELKAY